MLAWDTSGSTVSAALGRGAWLAQGAAVHVQSAHAAGGAQASATLLPALQGLLQQAGLAWRDVHALVVGQGPGAFTGLRTACSLAQGLALGLGDVPVIMVPSLMAMAHTARLQRPDWRVAGEIHVALDARMGQWYTASYRFDDAAAVPWQVPQVVQPPALWQPGQWLEVVQASQGQRLAYQLVPEAEWPAAIDVQVAPPSAQAMLHLAPAHWRAAQVASAADVMPLYVRDEVAQTMAQRGVAS